MELPFVATQEKSIKKQYYKDKILDEKNGIEYFVVPKSFSLLDFNEAFILGYLINTETIPSLKRIIIDNQEYFMCNKANFIQRIFINKSIKVLTNALNKLVDKQIINKIVKQDGFIKNTYISINYDKLDELNITYKHRLDKNM